MRMRFRYWFLAGALMGLFCLDAAPSHAMIVTQLDLTGGSVEFNVGVGSMGRALERLFAQEGTLLMGQYQPVPEIFPPVTRGPFTFSVFTSGVQGAPPPSAMIDGTQLTVDLTSLFFGISRGDRLKAWNIGGVATGCFDPETAAFSIGWEHLFDDRPFLRSATFTLQGKAVLAEVPIPAGAVLFATGLAVYTGVLRRHRRDGGQA